MEQRKTELIEDGKIGNCVYKVMITENTDDNYHGIVICKNNLTHEKFSGITLEVVYMECIEWLNNNCKI